MTQTKVILEEEISFEKMPPTRLACEQAFFGAFSWLLIEVGGSSSQWVGLPPELVILGALKKQARQTMRSKPESNIPPWSLHHLLPLDSCPVWVPVWPLIMNSDMEKINPFLSKLIQPWCFISAIETLTRQDSKQLPKDRESNEAWVLWKTWVQGLMGGKLAHKYSFPTMEM